MDRDSPSTFLSFLPSSTFSSQTKTLPVMHTQRPARATRSSLGKRAHNDAPNDLDDHQLSTPDPTPKSKRPRTSTTTLLVDGDANKENMPPLSGEHTRDSSPAASSPIPSTPRAARALRRTNTQVDVTPTRTRAFRRASTSAITCETTTTELTAQLSISTPPPTPTAARCNFLLQPIHTRARALLRATCNSETTQIAGRENERRVIHEFLTTFIHPCPKDIHEEDACMDHDNDDEEIRSLYISGSPGTGKTALVTSIIRTLTTEHDSDELKVVMVNCMALKGVDSLWERLIEDLNVSYASSTPRKKGKAKAKGREAVVELLDGLNRTKCVVILDELDHITPTAQSLSSLFSLPSATNALRIIGIANTHTLTSGAASSTIATASNTQTLHFAPYTPAQLLDILNARLQPLYTTEDEDEDDEEKKKTAAAAAKKFLPPPALMLLTKKIASLTGDVRSLFEVLRGAIDQAIASASPTATKDTQAVHTVTPNHVLAALKAYSPSSSRKTTSTSVTATSMSGTGTGTGTSETVEKVRSLGLNHRLVLLSILLASRRIEAGLSISPLAHAGSPVKRSSSAPSIGSSPSSSINTSGTGVGIDTSQLHAFYISLLASSTSSSDTICAFEPVSRSEFGDLLGMLEGVGLVGLSSSLPSASSSSTPTKAVSPTKRTFSRSTSFGGKAKGKGAAGSVGEVRIAEGVIGEDVVRGLVGSTSSPIAVEQSSTTTPQERELRAIWERERVKLGRDVKARDSAIASKGRKRKGADAFADASED